MRPSFVSQKVEALGCLMIKPLSLAMVASGSCNLMSFGIGTRHFFCIAQGISLGLHRDTVASRRLFQHAKPH